MLKSVLFSILITTVFNLYAQDSTASVHGRLKPNRIYMGAGIICNDSILNTCDIKDRIINNPAAYKEYNKYISNRNASTPFAVLWVLSAVSGLVTLNSNNNLSGKFFAASFVPLFVGMHIDNHRQKHLKKAISIYNSQF